MTLPYTYLCPMTALDIAQQYYLCFNEKDWAGMLALLSNDIRHEVNQGETRVGLERYRAFLAHMDECYDERLEGLVFFTEPTGRRVACEFTVHGMYKKTDGDLLPARGQQYVLPAGAFLEVEDGKISRVTTYYNLPLWIKLVSA